MITRYTSNKCNTSNSVLRFKLLYAGKLQLTTTKLMINKYLNTRFEHINI